LNFPIYELIQLIRHESNHIEAKQEKREIEL